jgi:hypothetical protein
MSTLAWAVLHELTRRAWRGGVRVHKKTRGGVGSDHRGSPLPPARGELRRWAAQSQIGAGASETDRIRATHSHATQTSKGKATPENRFYTRLGCMLYGQPTVTFPLNQNTLTDEPVVVSGNGYDRTR